VLQVPSFDSRVAMLLLEKELGAPWTTFYSELSPEPIAAASLGQVRCWCMRQKRRRGGHLCGLRDGHGWGQEYEVAEGLGYH
jgi:hypothetical protein